MLVEWNFRNEGYTDTWVRRCQENKISPHAVYEARPFYINGEMFVKILTKQGLRLMTVTPHHVKMKKSPATNKQLKDYL